MPPKEIKKIKFVRKSNDIEGTSSIVIGEKTITISGREIYETSDEREIEVLKKDSVFTEYKAEKKKKK